LQTKGLIIHYKHETNLFLNGVIGNSLPIAHVDGTLEPWASASGGREAVPSWIFIHGTDIVDRDLKGP